MDLTDADQEAYEALWQGRSGQPKDTSAPGTVDGTDEAEAV
jgi:hypothetical protein